MMYINTVYDITVTRNISVYIIEQFVNFMLNLMVMLLTTAKTTNTRDVLPTCQDKFDSVIYGHIIQIS